VSEDSKSILLGSRAWPGWACAPVLLSMLSFGGPDHHHAPGRASNRAEPGQAAKFKSGLGTPFYLSGFPAATRRDPGPSAQLLADLPNVRAS